MVLKCNSCGWVGCNLVPNKKENTSHCPMCNRVFLGIPAENANAGISWDEEKKVAREARSFGA